MASPAEIVRACFVQLGLVIMPVSNEQLPVAQLPEDGTTQCYVGNQPDDVDQMVCVYGPAGRVFGREMRGGKTLLHSGIKVIVRALDYPTGWALANLIATTGMDSFPGNSTVTVTDDPTVYNVQSIYRTSDVIELGEEVGKKRQLFSINARIALNN